MDKVRRLLLKGFASTGVAIVIPPLSFSAQAYTPIEFNAARCRAARLANFATFGANEDTVNSILYNGWEMWVEQQLAMPVTHIYPSATLNTAKPTANQYYSAWWTNALVAPDQLHQRVGFALSQWFVISSNHPFLSGRSWTTIDYYDLLLDGVNSNLSDLLYNVSTHPAMCAYLSSLYNKKGDSLLGTIPDENFARELLQLFTCGAEQRWRNGRFKTDSDGNFFANYTEEDVQELARVFTGIGIKDAAAWGRETGDWLSPVIEYPEYHDTDAKRLMGENIPAGQNLFDDIHAALNIILNKRTNSVAGNFCRFMIQRLTVSNPRHTYVRDVSIALIESNWNIKEMVKAIMLHPDAIDGRSDQNSETGRLKDPLTWYSSARRAIAPPRDQLLTPIYGPLFNNNEPRTAQTFNQAPLAADSVFGFFPWDFQPESIRGEHTQYINYTSPEGYLYNWNNVVMVSNKLWGNFIKKDDDVSRFMDVLTAGASDEEFTDFVLDQLLFGNYRTCLRQKMISLLGTRGKSEFKGKLRDALVLATTCPDFLLINLPQEV